MILCQKNVSEALEGIQWIRRTNGQCNDGASWDHTWSKWAGCSMEWSWSRRISDWWEEAYDHANSSLFLNSPSKQRTFAHRICESILTTRPTLGGEEWLLVNQMSTFGHQEPSFIGSIVSFESSMNPVEVHLHVSNSFHRVRQLCCLFTIRDNILTMKCIDRRCSVEYSRPVC